MILNEKDHKRILLALKTYEQSAVKIPNVSSFVKTLQKAKIVPLLKTPADLITMNSKVQVLNLQTQKEMEITLVYHHEADLKEKKISVFAPIGLSLLGQKVNEITNCMLPNGQQVSYEIKRIVYQPEAAGDLSI